jgi:hypothetical protein
MPSALGGVPLLHRPDEVGPLELVVVTLRAERRILQADESVGRLLDSMVAVAGQALALRDDIEYGLLRALAE